VWVCGCVGVWLSVCVSVGVGVGVGVGFVACMTLRGWGVQRGRMGRRGCRHALGTMLSLLVALHVVWRTIPGAGGAG
jgi:hypothetical protein